MGRSIESSSGGADAAASAGVEFAALPAVDMSLEKSRADLGFHSLRTELAGVGAGCGSAIIDRGAGGRGGRAPPRSKPRTARIGLRGTVGLCSKLHTYVRPRPLARPRSSNLTLNEMPRPASGDSILADPSLDAGFAPLS